VEHDDLLWWSARNGDAEAFATLFERHAKAIYNYCFRRIGDWSAAEDLLSVVFLEAWRRRDKELPPGKVLPWLYGIATNVVRNRRRSERRYRMALADTEGGGVLYKAHGWDFRAQVHKFGQEGLGLMTGADKVGFVIPRSLLGPDPEPGFNIVATSLGSHSDTAPDIGTFDVEPGGSTHPPLGPDRRPPKLLAFDSLGTRGKDAKLEYWVLEGRGRTRQVIRIFRGHRLLKTIWTPLADANPFGTAETTWHVPPKLRGRLRFTVRSIDAAGNKSALGQAALVVR
jgi:Sigma-70 region 2